MVKIRSKKYKLESQPKKDIIVEIGDLELYFQNAYSIVSLINDMLIGVLYLGGSLSNLLNGPELLGKVLYLLGSISLILRPLIQLVQNVYVYREKKRPVKYKMNKKPSENEASKSEE